MTLVLGIVVAIGMIVTPLGSAVEVMTPQIRPMDPRFDGLVPHDATIEKIADGFIWVEGPLWHKQGGYLLFSDILSNPAVD